MSPGGITIEGQIFGKHGKIEENREKFVQMTSPI